MGKRRKTIKILEEEIDILTLYIEAKKDPPKYVSDVEEFIDSCYTKRAELIEQVNELRASSLWHTALKVAIPAGATVIVGLGGACITSYVNKQIAISNQQHRELMAKMGFLFEQQGSILTSDMARQVTRIPKV